uniref:Uncharacterized protein n=1 Tax=Oryza sativa subsp. japonica TaxID=39947 RepID=Q6K4D5_ORYSJ|nr:hypothetical protein [Oryza sativa Japonica Group]
MRRRPRDGGLDAAASLRRQPHRGRCDGAVVGEQARYGGAGEASMQPRCGRMEEKWAAQTNSLLAEWAVISTGTSFSLDNPTPVKPTVRLDWYLMVIFKATQLGRLWSLLLKEDEGIEVIAKCNLLEKRMMELFSIFGWNSRRRIEA